MLDHLHRQGQTKRTIWPIQPETVEIGLAVRYLAPRSRRSDVHPREIPIVVEIQQLHLEILEILTLRPMIGVCNQINQNWPSDSRH
jgi:hypothetical protein